MPSDPAVSGGLELPVGEERPGTGIGGLRSFRGGEAGACYTPADRQGNFEPLHPVHETGPGNACDDALGNSESFDYGEAGVDTDPSERAPGGPVARTLRGLSPRAWQRKWVMPAFVFCLAFLVQSLGLYVGTFRYVQWMQRLDRQFKPGAGNSTGMRRPTAAIDHFKLQDNMAFELGEQESSKPFLNFIAVCVQLLWLVVAIQFKNLRLWTRTLFVGSILALLKGLIALSTVVPDSAGWGECRDRLEGSVLLDHFATSGSEAGVLDWLMSVLLVLRLWLVGMLSGMRGHGHLVCADELPSGSTCLLVLFSLGLYDVAREKGTRKLKPHFRIISRAIVALLLVTVALSDAIADLSARRQYTMSAALGMILTLLLYGSPVAATCTHHWLTSGPVGSNDVRDPGDEGDVLVPLCCVPFCFVHGRYFLHGVTASQAEEELHDREEAHSRQEERLREAVRCQAEEAWAEEDDAVRQLLEFQVLSESEPQRSRARVDQLLEAADRRLMQAKRELQRESGVRLAKQLAQLQARHVQERQATARLEEKASGEMKRLAESEARLLSEKTRLLHDVATARHEAAEESSALEAIARRAAEERRHIEELQEGLAFLESPSEAGATAADDALVGVSPLS